jgi:hypothetical protein
VGYFEIGHDASFHSIFEVAVSILCPEAGYIDVV